MKLPNSGLMCNLTFAVQFFQHLRTKIYYCGTRSIIKNLATFGMMEDLFSIRYLLILDSQPTWCTLIIWRYPWHVFSFLAVIPSLTLSAFAIPLLLWRFVHRRPSCRHHYLTESTSPLIKYNKAKTIIFCVLYPNNTPQCGGNVVPQI